MAEKNTEKQRAAEQQLAEIAKILDEELFKRLDTDEEGLNQVEASERLEEYGKNIIDTGNENSLAKRVREALINPFNVVLLIVAAVTLVTDVIIAEKPSWATFLMLIFVVAVSGIISFVQAKKSNSAAQKLQNMPSIKDRASVQLSISTLLVVIATLLIGFTGIAALFDLPVMVPSYMLWLAGLMVIYLRPAMPGALLFV